ELILQKVSRCLIPSQGYSGFDRDVNDINSLNLTSAYLHTASRRANQHLLNIGWESNSAGFCNAFPPESSPYHEWEQMVGNWIDHRDLRHHRHKAIIDGVFDGTYGISFEKDDLLAPLRQAHAEVHAALVSYQ